MKFLHNRRIAMKIGEIWNSNLFWFIFSVLLIAFAVNDKFTGHWGWNSWTSLVLDIIGIPLYGYRLWRARIQ